jgi:hypothetical protein
MNPFTVIGNNDFRPFPNELLRDRVTGVAWLEPFVERCPK